MPNYLARVEVESRNSGWGVVDREVFEDPRFGEHPLGERKPSLVGRNANRELEDRHLLCAGDSADEALCTGRGASLTGEKKQYRDMEHPIPAHRYEGRARVTHSTIPPAGFLHRPRPAASQLRRTPCRDFT